jgi:hypothetical protein
LSEADVDERLAAADVLQHAAVLGPIQ